VVAAVTLLLRRSRERLSWSWAAVLSWGGLRGALSMVLALSLAHDFHHRQLLVTMTFGVVLLSILVQGLTMAPVLRWLHLVSDSSARRPYDRGRGELLAARAARRVLDRLGHEGAVPSDVVETLRQQYDERAHAAEQEILRLYGERSEFRDQALEQIRQELLLVERDAVVRAARGEIITATVAGELTAEIDARRTKQLRDSTSADEHPSDGRDKPA